MKLSDLDAEIRSASYDGVIVDMLWFIWNEKHHALPFRKSGGSIVVQLGTAHERRYNVWTHVSGDTIHDLTVSPSYNCTASADHLLHCFIRNGELCPV